MRIDERPMPPKPKPPLTAEDKLTTVFVGAIADGVLDVWLERLLRVFFLLSLCIIKTNGLRIFCMDTDLWTGKRLETRPRSARQAQRIWFLCLRRCRGGLASITNIGRGRPRGTSERDRTRRLRRIFEAPEGLIHYLLIIHFLA